MSSRFLTWIGVITLGLIGALPAQANTTLVGLDSATLQSGYTVKNDTGTFSVGLPAAGVAALNKVFVKLYQVQYPETFNLTGQTLIGDLYGYQLQSDAHFQLNRKVWLQLSYPSSEAERRLVMKYWNAKQQRWKKLPTRRNRQNIQVFAQLKRRSAVVGVFVRSEVVSRSIVEGTASWYNGAVAATNAFPLGTNIRVTNPATGLSADTVVGSTWSADVKYGWLIDLPQEVFAAIGNISSGLIHVQVQQR